MKLTLTQIKKIADLEINPKEHSIVRVPFIPLDDPRFSLNTDINNWDSSAITPYYVTLEWDSRIQDWESNLEI